MQQAPSEANRANTNRGMPPRSATEQELQFFRGHLGEYGKS